MRILVSCFGCDGGKSGVGQYAMHLMRELPRVAPDIQFDAVLFHGEESLFVTDTERVHPISVGTSLQHPMKNLAWQQWAMPRLAAKGRHDLLFIPAGNRRMPYWTPCPRVGTFHDLAIAHLSGKYDRLHTLYNRHILPRLVRQLTVVISVSEFTKRDLLEYIGVPEDRIVVIPEAADTDCYYPRDKEEAGLRMARRFGIRPPYLIYISRIEHPGKNHVRLIRAFSRLKEKERLPHQLVLVGSDWHGADEVHRTAAASPAAKDIVFTGFAPQEAIPDLYCGADALAFPSLFEGFGLPVLEAMACGLPVACADAASMPEVAGGAALLFDPLNEESIEDALRKIVLDSGVRDDCIARGGRRNAEFSWKKTAEKTVEVFRRTVCQTTNCATQQFVKTTTNCGDQTMKADHTVCQTATNCETFRCTQGGLPTVTMFGITINNVTLDEVFAAVTRQIEAREPGYILTPNVDHVCVFQTSAEFREAYRNAFLVLADGTPIMWAARALGMPIKQKISGSDLVYWLTEYAARKGYSIFFFGAGERVAGEAAAILQARYPGLKVAGAYSPPLGFDKDPKADAEAVRIIRDAVPDICYVALGSPKQDVWNLRHYRDTGVPIHIGVGGSLDFVAGRTKRAPVWMQKVGLEWAWRLVQEPRRLWRRYLVNDMQIIPLFLRELRKKRQSRRRQE